MICRECGRTYHPESYGDPSLYFGGWWDSYRAWSQYCLPCVEEIAREMVASYNKYHNTCGPCPWCGKRWGCRCEVVYGGAKTEIPKEHKED